MEVQEHLVPQVVLVALVPQVHLAKEEVLVPLVHQEPEVVQVRQVALVLQVPRVVVEHRVVLAQQDQVGLPAVLVLPVKVEVQVPRGPPVVRVLQDLLERQELVEVQVPLE